MLGAQEQLPCSPAATSFPRGGDISSRCGAGNRLFEREAKEPEPGDLAKYYAGVRSNAAIRRSAAQAEIQRIVLLALCTAQTLAGVGGIMYVDKWSPMTVEVRLIQATLGLIAISGLLGLVGAWQRWGSSLQAFFITQIWSLSTVFSRARRRSTAAFPLSSYALNRL